MKITKIRFYGGAREKVCRLGLSHIFFELQEILLSVEIHVLDKKQANGAGRVRELIDRKFDEYADWVQSKSGEVHLIQPPFIKGIHRALVTILDAPHLPSKTNASDIGEGKADPGEAKSLFGIWKDNPAVDSVNGYLDGLRRERF